MRGSVHLVVFKLDTGLERRGLSIGNPQQSDTPVFAVSQSFTYDLSEIICGYASPRWSGGPRVAILQRYVKGSLWHYVLLSIWSSVRVSMVVWRGVRPFTSI